MSDIERWREPVSSLPSAEQLRAKADSGWRPVAIEWERGLTADSADASTLKPIPYGLRISSDCRHLEIDPVEREVIRLIVAMIAGDHPLSKIASELTSRGYRSRTGAEWTQVKVFRLLPRVIEFGPEILSETEWTQQKERLLSAIS